MRIIHHTDMDGLCAGAIVYNYFDAHRMDGTKFYANLDGVGDFVIDFTQDPKISTYASGYAFNEKDGRYGNVTTNELFVFVDLSISNANIDIIKKISENGGIIIWLDHHKSSLDYLDKVKNLDNFFYLIGMERSGALLAYDVFFKRRKIRSIAEVEIEKTNWDARDEKDKAYLLDRIHNTVVYPQYVDDYDRWQFKLNTPECKYTECFASGFMASIEGGDVTSRFHTRLLIEALHRELEILFNCGYCNHCSFKDDGTCKYCDIKEEEERYTMQQSLRTRLKDDGSNFVSMYNFLAEMADSLIRKYYGSNNDRVDIDDDKIIVGFRNNYSVIHFISEELTPKLMNDGLAILRYEESINYRMYKAYGKRYKIQLYYTPDGEPDKTFEAAVINRSCNSKIFGEDYDKYPVCICYQFTGTEYKYTLYSNSKFNFDCSEIAKAFGGGGHAGAAGFSTSYNMFENYRETGEPGLAVNIPSDGEFVAKVRVEPIDK